MLSSKAVQILKKIHADGLQVLWSFRVAKPYYGTYPDGEEMPNEDYFILKNELESFETQSEYVRISPPSKSIIRHGIENNHKYKKTFIVMPDGTLILTASEVDGFVIDAPDTVISEQIIEDAGDGNWETFTYWKSDYLIREKIDMPEIFEEKTGLLNQYSLTPLALKIIGEG